MNKMYLTVMILCEQSIIIHHRCVSIQYQPGNVKSNNLPVAQHFARQTLMFISYCFKFRPFVYCIKYNKQKCFVSILKLKKFRCLNLNFGIDSCTLLTTGYEESLVFTQLYLSLVSSSIIQNYSWVFVFHAGWCHVVCALFIPEAWFGNVQTMEPIILKGVPPERISKV